MFYQSVEFYVIAAVIAAAVIALAARPAHHGAAITRLLRATPDTLHDETPQLHISVDDDANLTLRRSGLPAGTAINLEITVKGHDIAITEHQIPIHGDGTLTSASIMIDFVGRDRYHLSYDAPQQSLFTALSFTISPGISIIKPFLQS